MKPKIAYLLIGCGLSLAAIESISWHSPWPLIGTCAGAGIGWILGAEAGKFSK